ncbi:hypothetical protein D3248_08205 [Leucobacter zeae]|nr:hypothetical protein [Leucobacter zeae]
MRALFPDIALDLDRALDAHGHADASAAFDAWIDARADAVIPGAGFAQVEDVESAERFQQAFAAARRAAAWFGGAAESGTGAPGSDPVGARSAASAPRGLAVPEPEAFSEAGVDFARLARAMAADPSLVPVPAPHGLGADAWRAAYRAAASAYVRGAASETGAAEVGPAVGEPGIAAGPLALPEGPGGSPLVLASEAERGFAQLDAVPVSGGRAAAVVSMGWEASAGSGAAPRTIPGIDAGSGSAERRRPRWTLRLVPAGQRPQTLGLGFAHGEHVSLPEMLMLQLMNLASGEELVDSESFTWLAGPVADGRMAARHVYDAGERVIRITCREVGSQGPHMGTRPPVG